MKVLALDFGSARTGVAVSDPTGTLARPLETIERAATATGLERIAELVRREAPERIVVGLPLTLRGEHGLQAQETECFIGMLERVIDVPVDRFDERFTSVLARSEERSAAGIDARAAAHLLSDYLEWASRSPS